MYLTNALLPKLNKEEMKKLILLLRWVLVLSILLITGSVGLVLVIVSFGTLRNLLNKYYLNCVSLWFCRINSNVFAKRLDLYFNLHLCSNITDIQKQSFFKQFISS